MLLLNNIEVVEVEVLYFSAKIVLEQNGSANVISSK